jgi:predicted GNAT family N-acyltransferase
VASSYNGAGTADAPLDLAVGSWAELGEGARAVRIAVFVVEQNIAAEEEWDEWDALSLHAVARDNTGQPIGTGRLLPPAFDADKSTGHIGRMAVLKESRHRQIGGAILQALMRAAPAQGYTAIVLHAQKYVASFYARHGFVAEGEEFLEVGIPHVRMRTALVLSAAQTGVPS